MANDKSTSTMKKLLIIIAVLALSFAGYGQVAQKSGDMLMKSGSGTMLYTNSSGFAVDPGFLQIPGVGWQTFGVTAGGDPHIGGYNFKSGCAYNRFTWDELEPDSGDYNFDLIDLYLSNARAQNQAFAFRVMLIDPGYGLAIPQWIIDKGAVVNEMDCPPGTDYYGVDLEDDTVSKYHEILINVLGDRYDDHPDLALVDIGSVGKFGEWHDDCQGLPSVAAREEIIDLYYDAFPNTPLTIPADDSARTRYAYLKGRSAWRGDSWGNNEGPGWNHHDNMYWPMDSSISDSWETGTVAFEPSYTLGYHPGPPAEIVDSTIEWHATFVQNKDAVIPGAWMSDIERLILKIGFRLVLRNATYEKETWPDSTLELNIEWENIGIAPPYRDHRIALRLVTESEEDTVAVTTTSTSIQGWLPGETDVDIDYVMPSDIEAGDYTLEMGIVFHSSIEHTIPIANYGKTDDEWYYIGDLTVTE